MLLIASGIGMLFAKEADMAIAADNIWFRIKITLVVILLGIVGYMDVLIKKAKAEKGGPVMAKIPKIGRINLSLAIVIIITAVLAFR